LRHFEDEMRSAETGHVYIFVLMLVFISAALLRGLTFRLVFGAKLPDSGEHMILQGP
jgi:hypothetical protein